MLSIGLYLGFIARILLKDFRDVKGDKAFGKVTFRLRYGPVVTCITSGALWLIALLVVAGSVSFDQGLVVVLSLGFVSAAIMLNSLAHSKYVKTQESIIVFIAKAANLTILAILVYFLCQGQNGLSDLEIQLITASVGSVLLILNFFRYKTWTARSL
jgi:4-hydroxybenzoate polyprenyltransferase